MFNNRFDIRFSLFRFYRKRCSCLLGILQPCLFDYHIRQEENMISQHVASDLYSECSRNFYNIHCHKKIIIGERSVNSVGSSGEPVSKSQQSFSTIYVHTFRRYEQQTYTSFYARMCGYFPHLHTRMHLHIICTYFIYSHTYIF